MSVFAFKSSRSSGQRAQAFPARKRFCVLLAAALPSATMPAWAANYVVTSSSDSVTDLQGNTADTGSLRYALMQANAAGGTNTISFAATVGGPIMLAGPLPLILNNLTIDGSGAPGGRVTIDGESFSRLLFVGVDETTRTDVIAPNFSASPLAGRLAVTLKNLTLANGKAQGGAGGGGGMGAGGALFVASTGDVTLDRVNFTNNQAQGGAGRVGNHYAYGGGGGLGGNGGRLGGGGGGLTAHSTGAYSVGAGAGLFSVGGGSGGGGYTGGGGNQPFPDGTPGTRSLAGISGSGGAGSGPTPGIGGANGGGGGNGNDGGGGGFGGGNGGALSGGHGGFGGGGGSGLGGGTGGAGGFGGGGGGGNGYAFNNTYRDGIGGAGGFGGGGGGGRCPLADKPTAGFGGTGGFGGGGGGSRSSCRQNAGAGGAGGNGGFGGGGGGGYSDGLNVFAPGVGGFAAGNASFADNSTLSFCGGGGAALGAAIFLADGSTLAVVGAGDETGSSSAGSVPAAFCSGAQQGQAFGSALFMQGGSGTVSFNLPAGQRYTFSASLADEAGAAASGAQNAGSPQQRGFSIDGPGTLVLSGANTYAGTTTVNAGALMLDGSNDVVGTTKVNAGKLGGIGSSSGSATLADGADISPGDPAVVSGIGTLSIGPLTWNPGGAMTFQLSASGDDKLVVDGALGKSGSGSYLFHIGMGDRPPPAGAVYTLIQSADASAFVAGDFNFDADATYQSLTGHFGIVGNDVQFTVDTIQSDRMMSNSFD